MSTEEEILAQLQSLNDTASAISMSLDTIVFLLQACAVALCMIWGAYFWRLVILFKNQTRIW